MGAATAVLAVPLALLGARLAADSGPDRAALDEPSAVPSILVPTGDPGHPSVFPPERRRPTAGLSPTADPSGPPTASDSVPPSRSGEETAGSEPPASGSTTAGDKPPPAGGEPMVLRQGDSGPEVVELQQRLTEASGLYYEKADGQFDADVRDAVATFQKWRAITGDPDGVYGENTRRQLEAETQKP